MAKTIPVFVYSPQELPYSAALLKAFKIPNELKNLGFFVTLSKNEKRSKLFKRHPETSKIPAKIINPGLEFAEQVARRAAKIFWPEEVFGAFTAGFHTDIGSSEMAASFKQDKFHVLSTIAEPERFIALMLDALKPQATWRLAQAVATDPSRTGSLTPVLEELSHRKAALPRRGTAFDDIVDHCDAQAADACCALLTRYKKPQVLALKTPWITNLRRLGVTVPGPASLEDMAALQEALGGSIPDELAQMLKQWDGLPAMGLLSAQEIAYTYTAQREMDGPVNPSSFDIRSDKVRSKQFWPREWTPFWASGAGDFLAVDEYPTTKGRKGQIIAAWHDPPTRAFEARSLGEWLWQRLAQIGRGEWVYDAEDECFSRREPG